MNERGEVRYMQVEAEDEDSAREAAYESQAQGNYSSDDINKIISVYPC